MKINDIKCPILTKQQSDSIAYMEEHPVRLNYQDILHKAEQKTGLNNYHHLDFIDRLKVQLQAVEDDKGLNQIGRLSIYNDCVRYSANRLLLEHYYTEHNQTGEIDKQQIAKPIIVAGLPRSGTTHLLNLIASDPRVRSMPYWESKEPLPLLNETATWDEHDPRYNRCLQDWHLQDTMMPLLKSMHEMSPLHVHEELELENLDFSSYNLEWLARVPQWRDYYLSHDQTPHYAYIKRVLKAMQHFRPLKNKDRWVLKCPQHLEQLPCLFQTFSDATVVLTHRDPVEVISSIVTMLAYGDRAKRYSINAPELAAYWIDRVERLLRKSLEDRPKLEDAGFTLIDLPFKTFMQDDLKAVNHIYDAAGLGLSTDARSALQAYLQANPRGKHGRIEYDLENDFDVSISALRKRFDFYYQAFDVRDN